MGNYNPVQTGSTAGYTSSTVANVYLAAEYLVAKIGEEAAQLSNLWDKVWNEGTVDLATMTAHFRYLDALSTPGTATEGSALPVVAWSPEGVAVSAGLYGLAIQISKVMQSVAFSALDRIAQQEATALVRSIESSIAALFPSLTAGSVGATGAALTWTHIAQGEANLDSYYAPQADRFGVIQSQQFFDLKKDIKGLNYGVSALTLDAKGNEQITIGGVICLKNNLVTKINSNADFAGAIITQEALGCVVSQYPQVEILDIPGSHAFSIDGTVAFGTGVIRPRFGCLVYSGVTA